jgi:LAO/AO transport system kinase
VSQAPESPQKYAEAIRSGDRRAIARAITLIESTLPGHARLGQEILELLVPHTGGSIRVGITGPPGVGKSTFIEALGLQLLELDKRIAVLAVDPSSPVTGGSILGDKTRMERLSSSEDVFIRPSPSGGSLGGVAHRTREVMLICEAAGYEVVLIETVGIGQSEVTVASMVDFFLVLLLPAGGDELQGIKRGVMELADALVVNKADGPTRQVAERTRLEYGAALHLLRPASQAWQPRALLASAHSGEGISEVWEAIEEHDRLFRESGELASRRRDQARDWMWSLALQGLRDALEHHPGVARLAPSLEQSVRNLEATPAAAARQLLATFLGKPGRDH